MVKRAAKQSPGRRIARAGNNSKQSERMRIGARQRFLSRSMLIITASVTALLVIVIGALALFNNVYAKPERVFWDMINNSLATSGVTESSIQKNGHSEKKQISQVSFNPYPLVHQQTDQLDNSSAPPAQLSWEIIGTRSNDYQRLRYAYHLQPNDSKDKYNSLYTQWIKDPNGVSVAQTTNSTLLTSPVLFGQLDHTARDKILSMLARAYVVDFKNVDKKTNDHRRNYTYNVVLKLRNYSLAEKLYAEMSGLPSATSITPGNYKPTDKINLRFTVDVLSRQLQNISTADKTSSVDYDSYGVTAEVPVPASSLNAQEFQQKVNSLRQ